MAGNAKSLSDLQSPVMRDTGINSPGNFSLSCFNIAGESKQAMISVQVTNVACAGEKTQYALR